jgi:hypothetical protein
MLCLIDRISPLPLCSSRVTQGNACLHHAHVAWFSRDPVRLPLIGRSAEIGQTARVKDSGWYSQFWKSKAMRRTGIPFQDMFRLGMHERPSLSREFQLATFKYQNGAHRPGNCCSVPHSTLYLSSDRASTMTVDSPDRKQIY